MSLKESTCVPCRGGVPTATEDEVQEYLRQVPRWHVIEVDGVRHLRREFVFDDFRAALEFGVQVGELAEKEQHHPDIHIAWGKAAVETWTHKIRGLHQNDFILAAKIDGIYGS